MKNTTAAFLVIMSFITGALCMYIIKNYDSTTQDTEIVEAYTAKDIYYLHKDRVTSETGIDIQSDNRQLLLDTFSTLTANDIQYQVDLPEEYMAITTNKAVPDTMLAFIDNDKIYLTFKPHHNGK